MKPEWSGWLESSPFQWYWTACRSMSFDRVDEASRGVMSFFRLSSDEQVSDALVGSMTHEALASVKLATPPPDTLEKTENLSVGVVVPIPTLAFPSMVRDCVVVAELLPPTSLASS